MSKSKIEWTNHTWNPTIGCSKVSDGCERCYAIIQAARLQGMGKRGYEGVVTTPEQTKKGVKLNWTGRVNLVPEALEIPLKIKKPTMFFVDSMSDLFHEKIPFEYIDKVFAVIGLCQHHIFQILTKRPDRALEYFKRFNDKDISSIEEEAFCLSHLVPYSKNNGQFAEPFAGYGWHHDTTYTGDDENDKDTELIYKGAWPFPNLWLGVSVEQKKHLPRIGIIRQVPAVIRMLSFEPLLEDLGEINLDGIGWVIVGGESGPGARPMHPDWVRSIRDQCEAAGVPFFFKQWGEWAPLVGEPTGNEKLYKYSDGENGFYYMEKLGKSRSGHMLDGIAYKEFPKT